MTKKLIEKETDKSDYVRINERKCVLLNYPSVLYAYKAKTTTNENIANFKVFGNFDNIC